MGVAFTVFVEELLKDAPLEVVERALTSAVNTYYIVNSMSERERVFLKDTAQEILKRRADMYKVFNKTNVA